MEEELKVLPAELGKHNIGAATVANIRKGDKVTQFTLEGWRGNIKVWAKTADGMGLKIGHKFDALEIEGKENDYNGEISVERWFVEPPKAGGFKCGCGGGFGRSYVPKTPAEIHSPSICGLIKSATECGGKDWELIATKAIEVYCEGIKKVAG